MREKQVMLERKGASVMFEVERIQPIDPYGYQQKQREARQVEDIGKKEKKFSDCLLQTDKSDNMTAGASSRRSQDNLEYAYAGLQSQGNAIKLKLM